MIKLFRNIRKKLLEQGKTINYLKYAIGEIVLVVIGILIALQINNWNQQQQNSKQEKQLLQQLLIEYNSNLNQLSNKILLRREGINSAIMLLSYRDLENLDVQYDSINRHLSRLILRPTFDPELGVTTELTNSGKLYILSNEELRNKISAFPSSLNELKEEEMVIFNIIEERFTPFLIENFQVGRIMSEFLDDEQIRSKVSLMKSSEGKSIKEWFAKSDPKPLLKHPDFEDYISILISNTTYTNDQSVGVKLKIEEIISLIKKELTD
ncbi:MAG: hypothetical protein K9I95_01890 [Flavobacteriaceae bacterium]|nr:hypothetical protein [Flavobacteriaceae bacterium]